MTTLSIPDMTCGHCKASVEAALSAIPGAQDIVVDLPNRQATVAGNVPEATLLAALDAAGYPATVTG